MARAVRRSHDVDAADVRVNVVGDMNPHHFGAELGVVFDLLAGHNARFQDLLVVVNVVDEAVEGGNPLYQTRLHAFPLFGGDHAGDQIKRNQALGAPLIVVLVFVQLAINGKSDAHTAKNHLGFFTARGHGLRVLDIQPTGISRVVFADISRIAPGGQAVVHFVEMAHGYSLLSQKLARYIPTQSDPNQGRLRRYHARSTSPVCSAQLANFPNGGLFCT